MDHKNSKLFSTYKLEGLLYSPTGPVDVKIEVLDQSLRQTGIS